MTKVVVTGAFGYSGKWLAAPASSRPRPPLSSRVSARTGGTPLDLYVHSYIYRRR
jgi:hypothetical protein